MRVEMISKTDLMAALMDNDCDQLQGKDGIEVCQVVDSIPGEEVLPISVVKEIRQEILNRVKPSDWIVISSIFRKWIDIYEGKDISK